MECWTGIKVYRSITIEQVLVVATMGRHSRRGGTGCWNFETYSISCPCRQCYIKYLSKLTELFERFWETIKYIQIVNYIVRT